MRHRSVHGRAAPRESNGPYDSRCAYTSVEVDRLGVGSSTPILRFGTQADSSKMPGAAVTMNPYVAAAKFVLGKQATARDVQAMGEEIAKQIADYARSHGVGSN
jgi:hypothetical protein